MNDCFIIPTLLTYPDPDLTFFVIWSLIFFYSFVFFSILIDFRLLFCDICFHLAEPFEAYIPPEGDGRATLMSREVSFVEQIDLFNIKILSHTELCGDLGLNVMVQDI